MLKYFKQILSKVSFDKVLFEKELKKAIKSLLPTELKELKDWCYNKFGELYRLILDRNFAALKV